MIIIVKLNEDQWKKIKPNAIISSSYGFDKTIFGSIKEIITADKVVALNGFAMWKKESTKKSIAERIDQYHKIFKLPDGKFAVSSQTFNQDISIKNLNIVKDQIEYYDIPTQKIYENKTFNNPNPENMRGRSAEHMILNIENLKLS